MLEPEQRKIIDSLDDITYGSLAKIDAVLGAATEEWDRHVAPGTLVRHGTFVSIAQEYLDQLKDELNDLRTRIGTEEMEQ